MKIVILYNTCHYVVKFRKNLISCLLEQGHEVIVVAPRDEYTPELERLGYQVQHWSLEAYSRSVFTELRSIFALAKIVDDVAPDFMFSFTVKPNFYGAIIALIKGQKLVWNIAGLGMSYAGGRFKKFFFISLYRLFSLGASHIFFQNPDDRRALEGHFFNYRIKSDILPGSGVDTALYRRGVRQIDPTIVRFGVCCRLLRLKGVLEVVEAFGSLNIGNTELHIAGEWQDDPQYLTRSEVGQIESAPNVKYLGALHPDRMPDFYRSIDVFVLPTRYPEGTPRSVLEAASSGLPCIVSDTPGCRQAVIDGKTGELIDPHRPEALARAMEKAAKMSPESRAQLGDAAREHMELNYKEGTVLDYYMQLLE